MYICIYIYVYIYIHTHIRPPTHKLDSINEVPCLILGGGCGNIAAKNRDLNMSSGCIPRDSNIP